MQVRVSRANVRRPTLKVTLFATRLFRGSAGILSKNLRNLAIPAEGPWMNSKAHAERISYLFGPIKLKLFANL
jgi:hypothetical protein